MIRGWLARVFHKVEGEEVEVTNFCFDTIQGGEEEDLPRNSFVATRNMVRFLEMFISCTFVTKMSRAIIMTPGNPETSEG